MKRIEDMTPADDDWCVPGLSVKCGDEPLAETLDRLATNGRTLLPGCKVERLVDLPRIVDDLVRQLLA